MANWIFQKKVLIEVLVSQVYCGSTIHEIRRRKMNWTKEEFELQCKPPKTWANYAGSSKMNFVHITKTFNTHLPIHHTLLGPWIWVVLERVDLT